MFAESRAQIYQSLNKEGFIYLDQALLICEMVDISTSSSAQVTCAAYIKTKNDIEKHKIGYEGQIEEPHRVEICKGQYSTQ